MNGSAKIINIKIHLPTSTSPNHTLVGTGGNRGHVRITGRLFSSAERNDSRKCACVLKLEHIRDMTLRDSGINKVDGASAKSDRGVWND